MSEPRAGADMSEMGMPLVPSISGSTAAMRARGIASLMTGPRICDWQARKLCGEADHSHDLLARSLGCDRT